MLSAGIIFMIANANLIIFFVCPIVLPVPSKIFALFIVPIRDKFAFKLA